jgi:DMSO/TMAO reductase YedYZ molybdopterin-dependent catalytic subunit
MDGFFSRKNDEEKMKAEGRMPPGQALTQKFPVLHYGSVPAFDPQTWNFKVWGEVENPFSLTWSEFEALPKKILKMDIHCVTRWSKFDTEWQGVHLKTLIDRGLLKIRTGVTHVMQHAENGFTTNLPLDVMLADNFLLATHFNGDPITPDHGYPLRGVVGAIPAKQDLVTPYFWKGAKWLRGLEFMKSDRPGFWEEAGYHNNGDVWHEERFG